MKISKDLLAFARRGSTLKSSPGFTKRKRPKTAHHKLSYDEQHKKCTKVYNYVFTDSGSPKNENEMIVMSEEDFTRVQKEKLRQMFQRKHSSMLKEDPSVVDSQDELLVGGD